MVWHFWKALGQGYKTPKIKNFFSQFFEVFAKVAVQTARWLKFGRNVHSRPFEHNLYFDPDCAINETATPISFSALVRGDPLRIYGKALWFLKLVFQAADSEDLVIPACTVFDWSTHVTDRQTELRWLRHVTAVAAVARNNTTAIESHY